MWNRRQFLVRGASASLALVHAPAVLSAPDNPSAFSATADDALITPEAKKAVEAGLRFLGEKQHEDGSFGEGGFKGNVGISSLAGLAFLAAGHQPDDSPRGKVVGKALSYVLSQENRAGGHPGYLHNPEGSPHGPMYGHGFATLFLALAHGKGKDKKQVTRRGEALERAVKLLADCQNKDGGWRYTPASKDADLTVTACQMMALAAARQAGLKVPKKTTDAGVAYIKNCFVPAAGGYVYMLRAAGRPNFARTAAAVAVLQATGVRKGDEVEKGLDFLGKNRPPVAAAAGRPDMQYFYGHYYAARALHDRGGEGWRDWYAATRKELVDRQREGGGWVDQIDSHYATAMACLVLLTPDGRLAVRPERRKEDR